MAEFCFLFCCRGEIIIGGYLLEELSSKPPKCRVTHVTRVDLKGKALGLLAGWSEKMCHDYMPRFCVKTLFGCLENSRHKNI